MFKPSRPLNFELAVLSVRFSVHSIRLVGSTNMFKANRHLNFELNFLSVCSADDYIRLVAGENDAEGRVEIQHDGEWGTVCDDGFGQEEAEVICKSLGYE